MKQISCFFLIIACASASPTHRNGYKLVTQQKSVMLGGYPIKAMTYVPSDSMYMYNYQERPSVSGEQESLNESAFNNKQDRNYGYNEERGEMAVQDDFGKPTRKVKPQVKEVAEDDQQADFPFNFNRNGAPSYNTFFPIVIRGNSGGVGGAQGGYGRISNEDGEGYYPGAATAIANSFSTGKGGVAKSHATSYGDPYLAMYLRNLKRNKSA